MELYRVEHLTFAYPDCGIGHMQRKDAGMEQTVLQDCSFRVQEGSFVTLCGGTGSGKTTLLRLLKKELQPVGRMKGNVYYHGRALADLAYGETAAQIGFVMQNPDEQPVTDKVWHELAFGLENMGVPSEEIRRRVAEISAYFGIDEWYEKAVEELSGGQKQLLNLAAVMVMRPRVLLLDEPTAQLDPIAAQSFMNILVRLNRELGMTILLAEHRLEDAFAVSDQVLVLRDGRLLYEGTPGQAARSIGRDESIYMALPCSARLYRTLTEETENKNTGVTETGRQVETGRQAETDMIPLTITQGRRWLQARYGMLAGEAGFGFRQAEAGAQGASRQAREEASEAQVVFRQAEAGVQGAQGAQGVSRQAQEGASGAQVVFRQAQGGAQEAHGVSRQAGMKGNVQECQKEKPILSCRQVWFHYKKSHDILCGVQFEMSKGELVSLLGSNGSGKTTFLQVIAGIFHADGGKVLVNAKRVGYLPQDIETLFAADTVEEELRLVGAEPAGQLAAYRDVHPYDLSGGEKQLLAWEKVLAGKPELLLLDEPTKGLDAAARRNIGRRLRELVNGGMSVLMVTHDIELAAAVSDRCGMLFRGELMALGSTHDFFHGNRFYTTDAARLSQGLFAGVLTEEELTARCMGLDKERQDARHIGG